jgi:hypothetical protein
MGNLPSFRLLLCLVPVFFMLHNMEETPFMEGWGKKLPVKYHPSASTPQFVAAVTFLTISVFVLTFASLTWLSPSTSFLLILGIQTTLFFNAFVPHILTTIRFRIYSPGVITAVLITIPFSLYLFHRALREGILSWGQLWILLGIAPFVMILAAYLSLQVGKVLTRWLSG